MQVVLKGGCQGTFGVDGSHWRHTQYNGVLALLTGRDGNGKNVALAMGIFAVENVDNWNWFFRMVKRSEQMAAALNRLAHRAWMDFISSIATLIRKKYLPLLCLSLECGQNVDNNSELQHCHDRPLAASAKVHGYICQTFHAVAMTHVIIRVSCRLDVVIISDRDKGIENALVCEFPQAHPINCLRHLKQNVKAGTRKKGEKHIPALSNDNENRIIKLGKATSKVEYDVIMEELETSNPGGFTGTTILS